MTFDRWVKEGATGLPVMLAIMFAGITSVLTAAQGSAAHPFVEAHPYVAAAFAFALAAGVHWRKNALVQTAFVGLFLYSAAFFAGYGLATTAFLLVFVTVWVPPSDKAGHVEFVAGPNDGSAWPRTK